MSEENVDRNREFIEAYNRRDFDAALKDFDPQVEWVLPPMQGFVDAGNRVAVRLRYFGRGKGSGAEIETEMYHQVATFRDGTIVRMEYFTDWPQALDAADAPRQPGRDPH